MSLERQDIRGKLDPDMHRALQAICDARGITMAEFIEALLVPEIRRLVHEAHAIAARTPGPGKKRDAPGAAGRGRDQEGER
ncbi:MAG: hypothetical protein ACYDAE_19635 [Steroidobacteraceae bacterium]